MQDLKKKNKPWKKMVCNMKNVRRIGIELGQIACQADVFLTKPWFKTKT